MIFAAVDSLLPGFPFEVVQDLCLIYIYIYIYICACVLGGVCVTAMLLHCCELFMFV